jgi:hypothetical protein
MVIFCPIVYMSLGLGYFEKETPGFRCGKTGVFEKIRVKTRDQSQPPPPPPL